MLVAAMVAAGCGGGRASRAPGSASTGTTISATQGYTLIQAQSDLPVGSSRFVFGIADPNNSLVTTGHPQVFVDDDPKSTPLGPFPATWHGWSPSHGDSFGTPPIPGFFSAQVTVPRAGTWGVLVRETVNGATVQTGATIPVVAKQVAAVGSRAISEPTPVATTPDEAAKIDTRQPPTPMHYISLDTALADGKPTVLVFATPKFCQSRLCGPVVDEALTVYEHIGRAKAHFVDVEIYPSGDTNNPAPSFLRWGFQTEPWVLVIDRTGVIRARFEGPSVAPEIEAAVTPLLSS